MTQCVRDKSMFHLHDIDGSLVLWAVTFLDDVVYGGSEKGILEDAAARYLPLHGLTKVGELDMLLALRHEMQVERYDGDYMRELRHEMREQPRLGVYMQNMHAVKATHAKVGELYHEAFHGYVEREIDDSLGCDSEDDEDDGNDGESNHEGDGNSTSTDEREWQDDV